MLIDEPSITDTSGQDPFLARLAEITTGSRTGPVRLQQGVYLIGHFNGNMMLTRGQYHEYPGLPQPEAPILDGDGDEIYINCYGVCDNVDNLLQTLGYALNDPARQLVVTLTCVRRDEQSSEGGWRWHKWGPYIGSQKPQHEYLYDDTHIDEVFCYHIYEKKVD